MKPSALSLLLIATATVFAACSPVDTTGLSAQSARTPTGNPDGLVTVTEYGDFQCPACKSAYTIITQPLLEKYGKQIRFEFKHFPLQTLHEYAMEAAQASECAADQGKFWEFMDLNYKNQEKLSSTQLRTWAGELQLDTALFDRCVRSGIKKTTVNADYTAGEKAGVDSTPTYFVNETKIPANDLTAISAAIEEALKQRATTRL